MRKLILASGSAQRKNLLKLTGYPFLVKRSTVEEITQITTSCAALVQHNALIKARDVASKLKHGVVIGADTVVYIGNKKLVLKPKDLKEARRILKILMSAPHWVYTGVALIDVDHQKEILAYEKTKVYMSPLRDKEIDVYHRRVHPLDKAGGFDIEGLGSIFIHRIEGCYTNVIGLPMAKLRMMLKKTGISLLGLLMVISTYGCTTEYNVATKKQEYYIFSTEKEVKIGEGVAHQFNEKFKMDEGVEENARVEEILNKLVAVCDRQDVVYFIKIIDEEDINATALPGGYIYVFKGVLDHAKNDDQLAGVIAHEIGHITAKHGLKHLQASYGGLVLQLASMRSKSNLGPGVNLALTSLFFEYSQKDELEADELGVKYMEKAGYDPREMINFLETIRKEDEKKPLREFSYFKSHPHIPERIANINRIVNGGMEFRDYIRLIDRVDEQK
ncbi:MAG: septum formation protein Maf [Candidatus Omnitrophica bacterium]|nr:septum formation protein Maf [Candidatus Omnitrophota bacterium]